MRKLTLSFVCLYVGANVNCLSIEKAGDTTAVSATKDVIDDEDATTVKTVKTKNGIVFENGVLKIVKDSPIKTTTESSEDASIDVADEAIKLMEMLTDDSRIHFTRDHETNNVTVDHYHDYDQLQDMALAFVTKYPHLISKYSLGNSVQGREIIAFKIRLVLNELFECFIVSYLGPM